MISMTEEQRDAYLAEQEYQAHLAERVHDLMNKKK